MKKQVLISLFLVTGFLGYAQAEVYFIYDEAGNQKYRGPASWKREKEPVAKTTSVPQESAAMDEKTFWQQVRVYPIPVNDILTIDWKEEADGLISSVSLYQHSTVHWKFQQQNIPELNRQIRIDMTGYTWGVYVLRFTLKDGRILSRNITKR